MRNLRSALMVQPDADAVAEHAAQRFVEAANEAIAKRGAFTVALTGGTSPLPLYERLAKHPYCSQIDWSMVHFFWGDDRAVPSDHKDSNQGAARRILIDALPGVVPAHVHPMDGSRADIENVAHEYEATLREVTGATPSADPVLDMILLGIGGDAHILSMHPGCADITNPRGLVVALRDVPMNPKLDRISFTPPMLEAAREVLVLAQGSGKANALAALFDGPHDPSKVPAQLLERVKGRLTIVCDAAAIGLTPR